MYFSSVCWFCNGRFGSKFFLKRSKNLSSSALLELSLISKNIKSEASLFDLQFSLIIRVSLVNKSSIVECIGMVCPKLSQLNRAD